MGLKKHEPESRFGINFTLSHFEGRNAVLQNPNPDLGIIKWPIERLPCEIREGDQIMLKIADNEEEYIIKRRLLEDLVN